MFNVRYEDDYDEESEAPSKSYWWVTAIMAVLLSIAFTARKILPVTAPKIAAWSMMIITFAVMSQVVLGCKTDEVRSKIESHLYTTSDESTSPPAGFE